MIEQYLRETWAYLRNHQMIDLDFEFWVNTLTNLQLVEYIDNAIRSGGDA